MKKIVFACFIATCLLAACKSDTSGNQSDGERANVTAAIDPGTIKLICSPVEEPNMEADAPKHEVFIQMGDSRIKIADILNCQAIEASAYEQYQIPSGALSAVGGWWAGAGDYLYVELQGDLFVVKQGEMFEEKTDNDYGYKTVMTFSKDGKEVF